MMMPDSDATAQDESTDEHDGPTMEIYTDDTQTTAEFTVTLPGEIDDDDTHLRSVRELVERKAAAYFKDRYNTRPTSVVVSESDAFPNDEFQRFDVVAVDGSSGSAAATDEYPLEKYIDTEA
jgi:hypothetical protein